MIACPHYQPRTKDGGTCLDGRFNGKPSHGTCARCIDSGENLKPYAKPFKVTFRKKGCGPCKPVTVVY